jgi:hypothetical protein
VFRPPTPTILVLDLPSAAISGGEKEKKNQEIKLVVAAI